MTPQQATRVLISKIMLDNARDFLVSMGISEESIQEVPIRIGRRAQDHYLEFLEKNQEIIGIFRHPMNVYVAEVFKLSTRILSKKFLIKNTLLYAFKKCLEKLCFFAFVLFLVSSLYNALY